MEHLRLTTPLTPAACLLRAGDSVLLSGPIYTARDAAHKRLVDSINCGENLPFDLNNQVIYYVGPTPARPGKVAGSAGPTTSYRMDPYTSLLLKHGLRGMIGKGQRSQEVVESMQRHGAVYFGAIGGAAALISRSIRSIEVVAYPDLGAEAIHQFVVEDMPLIVLIDSKGNNVYESEQLKYRTL